jgi:hypothetical protein
MLHPANVDSTKISTAIIGSFKEDVVMVCREIEVPEQLWAVRFGYVVTSWPELQARRAQHIESVRGHVSEFVPYALH